LSIYYYYIDKLKGGEILKLSSRSRNCKKCNSSLCSCSIKNENKIRNTNTFKPTINVNPVISMPPSPSPLCPPATQPNEPPECALRRQEISGDVFVATNGWEVGFVNVLEDYPTTINNSNVTSCEGVFGGGFHLAPVEELLVLRNTLRQMFSVNGQSCPVLIWSTIGGTPTLVYVVPESPNHIIVVPTPSIFCPAYHICINSGA
jgi:hypothetical protein